MFNLTDTQITEVTAKSTKFAKDLYEGKVVALRSAKTVKGYGNLEADFIGVKPQHVAYMLKGIIGDAKDLVVEIHGTHGVCLVKASAIKPIAAPKVTPKPKTAAKKQPVRKPKATKKATKVASVA
jgi:hypothetical protein